jgi:hypothetical protein
MVVSLTPKDASQVRVGRPKLREAADDQPPLELGHLLTDY